MKKIRILKFNQNLLTFGFFLFLSSLFWFFNALNKEYYIDLVVPVSFINLPNNKLQIGTSGNFVKVNVAAFGYQVINYKTTSIKPILVDFKKLSLKNLKGTKNKQYYILTSSFGGDIIKVLGPKLKINKIFPDTMFIDLVKVISKYVSVKPNLQIEFRKQFMLRDSVKFYPDSVMIKGLETIVDTIDAVFTEKEKFLDFHDSTSFDINLAKIKGAELERISVNCSFSAEQYTEMEYKLPVYVLNESIGYYVKLFPTEVKIVFNVGFDDYRKMSSDQFRIVVDYLELEESKSKRALLILDKKPDNVMNIRIFPQSVDYIIERND